MACAKEKVIVSRERGTPLYVQLYVVLRSQLQSGVLQPGDLLPPESELVRDYRVSRITVRAALEQLVNDGLIERQRGRGTFVRALGPETRDCLVSFTDQMLRAGRVPTTRLLRMESLTSRRAGFGPLPFAETEEVVFIERLRYLDGRPAALVRSFLLERMVPGIHPQLFEARGRGQSLLYVLERHFGIVLDKGEETLIPVSVSDADAALLGIPRATAVVRKTCLVRDFMEALVLFEDALWCVPQTNLVQRRATLT